LFLLFFSSTVLVQSQVLALGKLVFLLKGRMLLTLLLLIPLLGILTISTNMSYELSSLNIRRIKKIALTASLVNLFVSLIVFLLFDFSSNQYQFVQEYSYSEISSFDFYLGLDGLSIYFVMLTTIISPIAILSN
jgi:NADH:ubiquinone oxidoreductase subunit 4 (subunit M)